MRIDADGKYPWDADGEDKEKGCVGGAWEAKGGEGNLSYVRVKGRKCKASEDAQMEGRMERERGRGGGGREGREGEREGTGWEGGGGKGMRGE